MFWAETSENTEIFSKIYPIILFFITIVYYGGRKATHFFKNH